MADEKKNNTNEETVEEEINLDDLEQVTGGSIRNVQYTETEKINKNIKGKI